MSAAETAGPAVLSTEGFAGACGCGRGVNVPPRDRRIVFEAPGMGDISARPARSGAGASRERGT